MSRCSVSSRPLVSPGASECAFRFFVASLRASATYRRIPSVLAVQKGMRILNAVLAVLLFALPTFAQSTDMTAWLTSQRNEEGGRVSDTDPEDIRFDDGSGFGIGISRRFGSRLSGELALFRTSSGAEIREGAVTLANLGDVELTPLTAMGRFHFTRSGRWDVYAGAGVAHVRVADLSSADLDEAGLGRVTMENETTGLVGGGLGLLLTPSFGLAVDVRYMPLELSGRVAGEEDAITVDMNPLFVSAGVKLRF